MSKTTNFIPTYEEALEIVKNSEAFYFQTGTINNFEYKMFNYRLASYDDFLQHDAFELRGLTFIWNGTKWVRHIALKKFFNVNENISTQENILKDKEVASVEFKEDGSLISLVILPDGVVIPKTKMSFSNEQTVMVSEYLKENPKISEIVSENSDKVFLFELVSPFNKIVLKYDKTELRLIQIRNAETGEFLPLTEIDLFASKMNISQAKTFVKTFKELQEEKTKLENVEGWVIKFTDNQIVKLKTDWYFVEHKLKDDITKENILISMVLDECIDDILSQLEDGEEKELINSIISKVDRVFNHRVASAEIRKDEFKNLYNGDRKMFALNYSKTQDFGSIIKSVTQPNFELSDAIKNAIKNETKHLEQAREFLKNI